MTNIQWYAGRGDYLANFPEIFLVAVAIPAAIYRSAQGPGLEIAPKSALFKCF